MRVQALAVMMTDNETDALRRQAEQIGAGLADYFLRLAAWLREHGPAIAAGWRKQMTYLAVREIGRLFRKMAQEGNKAE